MKTEFVHVYLGYEVEDTTECRVLNRLVEDLERRGVPAVVLANFRAGKRSGLRQIDLVVATAGVSINCEVKGYSLPVIGRVNGPWKQVLPDQQERDLDGNPFEQAQGATYAVSDGMRALARRDRSLGLPTTAPLFKQIDTVVCLYPNIPVGSDISQYNYVTVVGYDDLLARILQPRRRPSLGMAHWEALAQHLGLYRRDERSDQARALDAKRALVDDYARRFLRVHAADLHTLVAVTAEVDGVTVARPDLGPAVRAERATSVIGPSGFGKSHLARHLAVSLSEEGHLVLWLRCSEYERGRFSMLLARAAAPFTTERVLDLVNAARECGRLVAIVADGLDECPHSIQGELLEQLSAFKLRVPAGIILTTRMAPRLPEPLTGVQVRLRAPDHDERVSILSSYGARHIEQFADAFRTPFELSIAADVARDLPGALSRSDLLDAYINRRAGKTAVRAALRRIARSMDAKLRSSLPTAEVVYELQRQPEPLAPSLVDEALACPLVTASSNGYVSFSHEILARFLAAEHEVLMAPGGDALGRVLAEPRHADLRADAVALVKDPQELQIVLANVIDRDLLADALTGRLGPVACDVTRGEAARLLAEANLAAMPDTSWLFADDSGGRWKFRSTRVWTSAERSLLEAVGMCLPRGMFVHEVALLLRRTDTSCIAWREYLRAAGDRQPVSTIVAALYGGPDVSHGDALAASIIARVCTEHHYGVPSGSPAHATASILLDKGGLAYRGCLYVASLLLDARARGDAELVSDVISSAWEKGGYHLRLQALWMAERVAACLNDEQRARTVAALQRCKTENPLLNGALFEALAAYGAFEPVMTLEQIQAHIADLLESESEPGACLAASEVVSNQYEDQGVFGPYFEAVNGLQPSKRRTLLVMAAKGSRSSFETQLILGALNNPDDLTCQKVQQTFLEHTAHIDRGSNFIQATVAVYIESLLACAQFCDRLPPFSVGQAADPDQQAWRLVSVLLFELEKGRIHAGQAHPGLTALADRLSEHAAAAVDVLFRVSSVDGLLFDSERSVHKLLLGAYPGQIRSVLEWGLTHRDRLTTYFELAKGDSRDEYIVSTLAVVGGASTMALLRGYVGDPRLGGHAAKAVWRLSHSELDVR